jgi:hypothetical protein
MLRVASAGVRLASYEPGAVVLGSATTEAPMKKPAQYGEKKARMGGIGRRRTIRKFRTVDWVHREAARARMPVSPNTMKSLMRPTKRRHQV